MNVSETRDKATEELMSLHKDLTRQLWRARFDNHSNQLDDTSLVGKLRRDIARVNTVLTERGGEQG
jgi:large subunit ribosomal protein L29